MASQVLWRSLFFCKSVSLRRYLSVPTVLLSPSCSRWSFSRRMTSSPESTIPTVRTVSISFSELKENQRERTRNYPFGLTYDNWTTEERNADLCEKIEEGFGPNGLGILSVKDVPGFSSYRRKLLRLAPRLARLPEEVKKELEDPDSRYNFGWSHGKEKLESGKLDTLKGSFYANPLMDVPTTDASEIQRYPSYCGSNIWPKNALPELEEAFKALGKLMFDIGLMIAYHCDQYVSKGMKQHRNPGLEQLLLRSRCHKGRLLYYFPSHGSKTNKDSDSMSSWCGWHTDHGSLTGLSCAIFSRNSVEVACPDHAAGLYVQTRSGQIVKVVYGEDEIAYQIGETTAILSRGYLCATPHCVRAPRGEVAQGIERSTFALFMQPDWDQKLCFPKEATIHERVVSSSGVLTFGEYTENLLNIYYHTKP